MLEAMWAYWAVYAAVVVRGDATLAYGLCYVSATTVVVANMGVE